MKKVMTPFGVMENHSYAPKKKLERGERELAESARRKLRYELNEKDARQKWYLELMIAACLGAALALSGVVAHGMLTTEWTW